MKMPFYFFRRRILKPLQKMAATIARKFRDDGDDNQFNHPFAIF